MHRTYQQDPDRIVDLVVACLQEHGLLDGQVSPEQRAYVAQVVSIMGERLRLPRDILTYGDFFFVPEVAFDPAAVERYLRTPTAGPLLRRLREGLSTLDPFDRVHIEQMVRGTAAEMGLGSREVIHPLRVALTGKTVGPGLFELMEVLGRERVLRRLDRAIAWCGPADTPTPAR